MTIGGPAPERRGRLTAPGWSSWLPMRCRGSPAWRQGWLPSKPPSHASLKKVYPWTCGDGPQRHGTGERDLRKRRVRGDRALPADVLDPRGTWRLPNRECLAGGDRRLVGEEESEDIWRCLTLARCQSVEDLSLDRLLWPTTPSARFDPALCWARDASRSSEGLSCRSGMGPMFSDGTAGPTVGWGGESPTNWSQFVPAGWAIWDGSLEKTPRKRRGVVECKSATNWSQFDPAEWAKWDGSLEKNSAKAQGCRRV